jgi:putative ABC transport system ATP-binding protein
MIQVQNISKVFNPKKAPHVALKNISFDVIDGEQVAIVGKSGSGKSTLMHIMAGLDAPTSGSVVYDGQVLTEMTKNQINTFRNTKIGFVFQQFFLFPQVTVFENIAFPLKIMQVPASEIKSRVQNILSQVGLADTAHSFPSTLSGGEKQRVCIARALVTNPSVVFADEPTGNLDSETGTMIERLLFEMQKNRNTTIILVTHDEDLARRCDRIITIKDGNIQ